MCPILEENMFFNLASLGHKNKIMKGRGFWRWLGQESEVNVAWTRNCCGWPSSPLLTIQRSKHPVLGLGQLETFLISSLILKIKNISNFSPKLNKNLNISLKRLQDGNIDQSNVLSPRFKKFGKIRALFTTWAFGFKLHLIFHRVWVLKPGLIFFLAHSGFL